MSGSRLSRLPTPYQFFDGWVMSDAAAYLVPGCLVCFWCLSLLIEFGMLSTRTLFIPIEWILVYVIRWQEELAL